MKALKVGPLKPLKYRLFCRPLKCLDVSVTNRVDPDQTAPVGAVWSGFTLFL